MYLGMNTTLQERVHEKIDQILQPAHALTNKVVQNC